VGRAQIGGRGAEVPLRRTVAAPDDMAAVLVAGSLRLGVSGRVVQRVDDEIATRTFLDVLEHHDCINYDAVMRTTVDLPPAVHRRAVELAKRRGESLSSVIADLTMRGFAQIDEPVTLRTDPRSGLPVLSIGRRITADEVADALDDE
jgi:hypothetical protein